MGLVAHNKYQNVIQIPSDGTQVTGSAWGVALTGSGVVNTYGALTQVVGALDWGASGDSYEIEIVLSTHAASATARNAFVTVAIDGVDKIFHLQAAKASAMYNGGGQTYRFPLHIASGSVISAKLQIGDAASLAASCYIAVKLYCDPSKPWVLRTGTGVETIGADTSTTTGVSVTQGTSSEGAWVKVGSLTSNAHALEFGWGNTDTAINNLCSIIDIGVDPGGVSGSPTEIVGHNLYIFADTTETLAKRPALIPYELYAGDDIYVRVQGAPEAGDNAIIYTVTGEYAPPTPYTVSGTVTVGGAPAPNGRFVGIYAVDEDGVAELVTSVFTSGGTGAFSASVPDNVRSYFAYYEDGATVGVSQTAAPSTSHNITIGGGADATAPTLTVISTPSAPNEPYVFQLYDNVGFRHYTITCKDHAGARRLVVYDSLNDPGEEWEHPFSGRSTLTGSGTSGDPYVFTVYRLGGWPTGSTIEMRPYAVDTSGNGASA